MSASRLSPSDEGDLEWFLWRTFISSSLGAMIDKARTESRDSVGKRVRPEPLWERDEQGRIVGQRQYTHVGARSSRGEPHTPEPCHLDTARHDRVGDRLRAVGRLSRPAAAALASYHGEAGARWAMRPQGRVWCLTPLCAVGERALAELAAERTRQGQLTSELQPAEQLAQEDAMQRLNPTDARGLMLRRLRDSAEELLSKARATWNIAGELDELEGVERSP